MLTDHSALKSLLNTPHPSEKLACWGLALQELDLDIEYRPGRQNSAADTLSRIPQDNPSEPTETNCAAVATLKPIPSESKRVRMAKAASSR